jgi:hypothetical protein
MVCLEDTDKAALAELLHQVIVADHYTLSPTVMAGRGFETRAITVAHRAGAAGPLLLHGLRGPDPNVRPAGYLRNPR